MTHLYPERLDDEALSGIRHFYDLDPTKLADGPTCAAANVVYLLRHIAAQPKAPSASLATSLDHIDRKMAELKSLPQAPSPTPGECKLAVAVLQSLLDDLHTGPESVDAKALATLRLAITASRSA